MRNYKSKIVVRFGLFILLGLAGCKQNPAVEIRDDFKKYYDQFNVEGSFVLYDQNKDKYIFYNQNQYTEAFTPASTFKICNSLIGLETGVISNEDFIIPWDSVIHQNQQWNKDHDLKTAFQNSTVWYFQELARRVGGERMKFWLDKANYGNTDTTGGIDRFWLTGGLRISPKQQILFLRRLHDDKLPFSKQSLDIVKKIMIVREKPDFIFRAKTGWGSQDNLEIGWYVGYMETSNNVYYFVNCIQNSDTTNQFFANARKEITHQILEELNLLPPGEFSK